MQEYEPIARSAIYATAIVAALVFIWHCANMSTRNEMIRNLRNRKVDKRDVYVTPVALTRHQVRVSWPDCPVPFFVWRLDRVRGIGWRLTFSYQIGTTTTITQELIIREDEVRDEEDDDAISYCRRVMMEAMSHGNK